MRAKYWHFAWTACRQTLAQRAGWIGRCALFGVIMTVFSHLWRATFRGGDALHMTAVDMTWYMAATEWIVLSVPNLHLLVEGDVRSGDIAYQLSRPYSFLGLALARGFGAAAAHLVPVGLTGIALARWTSGAWPTGGWDCLYVLPLGLVAIVILVVVGTTIGLTAFWLQDSGPVYWVWQKFLFTLGGLILPLAIYPEWLRTFAEFTPFSALLSGPASMMLQPDAGAFALALTVLLFWGALAAGAARLLYGRGLKILDVNGG